MGLRLRILSWWTPEWFLKKSLDELADSTINGLGKLLNEELPVKNNEIIISSNGKNISSQFITDLKGDLDERRRIMTMAHNELVEALINTIGQEEGISKGRIAMYHEGLLLGQKFKRLLGVGDDLEDLITAAKILYTILGIDFVVEEKENEMIMVVNHCSLANNYNSNTCKVLSAADEGVVHGLNPDIHMKFVERITQGHDHCLASLKMNLPTEDK